MRPVLLSLALSALASTANAALLHAVSPGPPADPSDYLEIEFTFDVAPPNLKAN